MHFADASRLQSVVRIIAETAHGSNLSSPIGLLGWLFTGSGVEMRSIFEDLSPACLSLEHERGLMISSSHQNHAVQLQTEEDVSSRTSTKRKATWVRKGPLEDRRKSFRSTAAFPVQITPMDENFDRQRDSFDGTVLNISQEGVCVEHHELIVEPYVRLSWQADGQEHYAMIRLKWCRTAGNGRFLSGGRILGVS